MEIIKVEQGTDEWLRMRLGKITGTKLKAVMAGKQAQETLTYELVAEQLTGQSEAIYVNSAMQWGTDHEAEAVECYRQKTKKHPEEVGFCISKEFPYLALSPDRLIKRGTKYAEAVEVKCPTTKTAIKYMHQNKLPSEYKWQVVNYFLVVEDLKSLDFVVYDPRIIDAEKKMTIITVKRKELEKDIEAAKERLVEFRKNWEKVYDKVKGK